MSLIDLGLKNFITLFILIKTVMWSSSEFLLQKQVLQLILYFNITKNYFNDFRTSSLILFSKLNYFNFSLSHSFERFQLDD